MADIIQIVDEDNNPIGVAERKRAHNEGLIHRVVRLLVFDENGRLFL